MVTFTPILKLRLPAFDQDPWDQDINGDLSVLDATMGRFFGYSNIQGVWQNSVAYTAGQSVIDSTDSSMWTCVISHTSSALPATFADDRTTYPSYWTKIQASAYDYAVAAASSATNAQNSANNAAISATNAANSASVVAGTLPLAGGTMTGPLILSADPTVALGAATKQYVDSRVGGTGYLPLSGGTLTGPLTLSGAPTTALMAATKAYVDGFLRLSGGTLTGTVSSNATISTTSNMFAAAFAFATGGGYINADANYGNWVFDSSLYRFQYTRSTHTMNYVRGSDNVLLWTLDQNGNTTQTGQVSASQYAVSTTGFRLSGDANYSYISMDTSNWNLRYDRSTGQLNYFRSDGTLLFYISPTGNVGAAGNMGCVALGTSQYATIGTSLNVGTDISAGGIIIAANYCRGNNGLFATTDNSFGLYISGSSRILQYAGGWYTEWDSTQGNLNYIGGGSAKFQYRATADNMFQNFTGPFGGAGAYVNTSDANTKNTIADITYGTPEVRALMPKSFIRDGRTETELGFIAQEVDPVVPEAAGRMPDGTRTIMNEMLTAVLWNAVKQIDARVTTLEGP